MGNEGQEFPIEIYLIIPITSNAVFLKNLPTLAAGVG
jgi:hypothetical protein